MAGMSALGPVGSQRPAEIGAVRARDYLHPRLPDAGRIEIPPEYSRQPETEGGAGITPQPPRTEGEVRVATWNILYDTHPENPKRGNRVCLDTPYLTQPTLRQLKVSQILREMDADVLCLNEVTPTWLRFLCSQEWLADHWLVEPQNCGSWHRVVVFSRMKPDRCMMMDIINPSRPRHSGAGPRPAVLVDYSPATLGQPEGSAGLCLIAAHLTAYQKLGLKRQEEMEALYDMLPQELSERTTLILGDLNVHNKWEDKLLFCRGFKDTWVNIHGNDDRDGITWDAHVNPMIPHLWPMWYESRRMRLDRILERVPQPGMPYLKASTLRMFGDDLVFPDGQNTSAMEGRKHWVRGGGPTLSDKILKWVTFGLWLFVAVPDFLLRLTQFCIDTVFRTNIRLRRSEAHKFLMPSDHFGLVTELRLTTD